MNAGIGYQMELKGDVFVSLEEAKILHVLGRTIIVVWDINGG